MWSCFPIAISDQYTTLFLFLLVEVMWERRKEEGVTEMAVFLACLVQRPATRYNLLRRQEQRAAPAHRKIDQGIHAVRSPFVLGVVGSVSVRGLQHLHAGSLTNSRLRLLDNRIGR